MFVVFMMQIVLNTICCAIHLEYGDGYHRVLERANMGTNKRSKSAWPQMRIVVR